MYIQSKQSPPNYGATQPFEQVPVGSKRMLSKWDYLVEHEIKLVVKTGILKKLREWNGMKQNRKISEDIACSKISILWKFGSS